MLGYENKCTLQVRGNRQTSPELSCNNGNTRNDSRINAFIKKDRYVGFVLQWELKSNCLSIVWEVSYITIFDQLMLTEANTWNQKTTRWELVES
jgi:hypothetical protein